MRELSLNKAANLLGIGSVTLRERTESGLFRAIPVKRKNAKDGITYKYREDWLNEDQAFITTTRIEKPVIHIDFKETIQRILAA